MTVKKLLLQKIEFSLDSLLEETLDFLRFLKTKQELEKKIHSTHKLSQKISSDSQKNNQPKVIPYRLSVIQVSRCSP